jgi:hypothetical protein
MANYINSEELLTALRASGKTPDSATMYAYAFGMAWANLSPEQQAKLVEIAKA